MVYVAPLRLANYRDPVLELEALMRSFGRPLDENALQLALKDRAPYYRNNGPDLVHTLTGKKLEEQEGNEAWVTEHAPHWFLDYTVPDENERLQILIDEATGTNGKTPSLKARGELIKEVGQRRFEAIMAERGADPKTLKPGTKEPVRSGDDAKKQSDEVSPFSAKGWSLRAQGEYVKKHGTAAAEAEAARFGVKLGSTKPNPKYNR
jgi:hypothetical protein